MKFDWDSFSKIRSFSSYSLTTKLILAFLAVSLIPLGLQAFLNDRNTREVLIESANQSLLAAVSQTAASIDAFIEVNRDIIHTEAQLPTLVAYLSLPVERRSGSAEEAAVAATLDELRRKNRVFIDSYALLDSQGQNVVDTNPSNIGRDESSQDYYQKPLETGLPYVSAPKFVFPSTEGDAQRRDEAVLFFSSPVRHENNDEVIGVLRMRYKAIILQQLVVQNNGLAGEQSYAILVDENLIYLAHGGMSDLAFKSVTPLEPSRVARLQASGHLLNPPAAELSTNLPDLADGLANAAIQPYFTTELIPNEDRLNLAIATRLETQPWWVVFAQPQDIFLAPVQAQTRTTLLLVIGIAVVVAAAAFAMGRLLANPLVQLTQVVTQFTGGDLEARASLKSRDESGLLAASFNMMAEQVGNLLKNLAERTHELEAEVDERKRAEDELQQYKAHLEEQVAERTVELESRVEQLATLNRITRTVASVYNLQAVLDTVAQEMVALVKDTHSAGIALLNDARTELTVVADYSRDDTRPGSVGVVIPLAGNPSSLQAVETGRSIVVPQAQTNPLTAPIHDILHERGTQCLMIVPLLVRGEVIGTIGLTTDHPDREFTEAEVKLAETIAGQVAETVKNAQLFEEMQEAKEAAELASQAKSDFLANVSHELRTPLTSVLGFAKISQQSLEKRIFPKIQADDRRTKRDMRHVNENIEIIVTEGERLTSLINDVLDLAKIEAGKVDWNMQPLAISEVVERAVAATVSLFEQKGLGLIKDVSPDLPEIVGDHDKLLQVMINLISNAVKFTDQGSVTCQARQMEHEIVVSIIDTGLGIAKIDQPQIFEKFKQVGDTLTDKPQGTGLGLPICKEIVGHHGGRIWVESELGQGSTFSFALSVQWAEIEADVTAQPVELQTLIKQLKAHVTPISNSNQAPKTILIVDDEAPIRRLLRQELGEAGYRVREAANGQEALIKVAQEKPDLVILDVVMPNMNGFNAAALLKNDPQTMEVPIILLTTVEDKARGYRLGVDRYLSKPINVEQLLQEVDVLLTRSTAPKDVLVVDKEVKTIQMLTEVLQAQGYNVNKAHNEAEFVEKAISTNPNVMLVNTMFSEEGNSVRALRFEKRLENAVMLFYQ